ncbi:hypothetical protein [Bythopirellula polymerisocia]|uniref:PEP-CTERM protein-sorting domain-containing protein n=1 Tax=Bythopirellula polymerisocia TaxID=2528003 RepID=A0A5C6CHM4_9BACT|nr:hypothetical protein [Bythopirellula polymerisocia]TWU22716.1 hypothetical protein Pla144_41770 [Bythopirellula polymerisocia]
MVGKGFFFLATMVAVTISDTSASADLVANYSIGSGLLSPNGETLFVDNAALGGGDFTPGSGFVNWVAEVDNIWSLGDSVQLTGIAIPIQSSGTGNQTTQNGTFTFSFYDIGPDNAFGLADTLVGTRTADFKGNGTTNTDEYYAIFDTPLSFTAAGNGVAVGFGNSAPIRLKINNTGSSAGVVRKLLSNGSVVSDITNPGFRMSLAGTAVAVPEPTSFAFLAIISTCVGVELLRRRLLSQG